MTTKDKDMSEQSIKAESQKHVLAAMANSFKEGHLVDVLDIECLRIAAEEITYLEKKVEKAQDINSALLARIAELEALSVTNIMIDVVPGDGSGLEVYAKSVTQIEDILSDMVEKVMELEAAKTDAERYRWLRDKANYAKKSDPTVCIRPFDNLALIEGEKLDAAIDAEIRGNE